MRRPEKIKTFPQWFFGILFPLFRPIRGFIMKLGLVHHTPYRQPFLVGMLKPQFTVHDFKKRLHELGYINMPVAWDDPGQVCSMRKIDPIKVDYQYHIRLFADRCIHGHHEETPEDHPYEHLEEIGFGEATEFFKNDLRGMLE